MTPKKKCPLDGTDLALVSDCGIVDYDGRWDLQVTRYECENNHVLFIGSADEVHEGEAEGET